MEVLAVDPLLAESAEVHTGVPGAVQCHNCSLHPCGDHAPVLAGRVHVGLDSHRLPTLQELAAAALPDMSH
eukprot:6611959-Pyramimonas_sp.AAC.1